MATQQSFIKFTGKLGDLSFYRRKGKYLVRSRSQTLSYSEQGLEKRRQLNSEFGSAAGAVKLLKAAFHELFDGFADYTAHGRLQKSMMRVLKSDPVNPLGERTVVDGDWELFPAYRLDPKHPIYHCCRVFLQVETVDNKLKVECLPFNPINHISSPPSATHFQFSFTLGFVDFHHEQFHKIKVPQPYRAISYGNQNFSFEVDLPGNFTGEVFIGVGLQNFALINGKATAFQDKRYKGAYIERIMAMDSLGGLSEDL